MDVRDSPPILTKSLRIPSRVSSSTRSVPVRPPARPVQTTGAPRRLRALATLMPFPPALGKPTLARCRCPGWKLGTTSVRSIAALSVTVTIIRLGAERTPRAILAQMPGNRSEAGEDRGEHVSRLVDGPVGVPARPLLVRRRRDVPRGDEVAARHLLVPLHDDDLAEL